MSRVIPGTYDLVTDYSFKKVSAPVINPERHTFEESFKPKQQVLQKIKDLLTDVLKRFKTVPRENIKDLGGVTEVLKLLLDPEVSGHDPIVRTSSVYRKILAYISHESAREPSQIQKEWVYQRDYRSNYNDIINEFKALYKNPSLDSIKKLLNKVDETLEMGEQIIYGTYKDPYEEDAQIELTQEDIIEDEQEQHEKFLEGLSDIDYLLEHILEVKKDPSKRKEGLKKLFKMLKHEFESSGEVLVATDKIANFTKLNPGFHSEILSIYRLAFNSVV